MESIVTANPTTPLPDPTPKDNGPDRLSRPDPGPRGHIGWIVVGSLAAGLVAALLLAAAPFIPAEESHLTGAVLCGFAVGWAMLAVLSVRFTDQPQRWAAAPALFMGLCGVLLVGFGSSVQAVLNWVWPPAMLALAIWMITRVRRQLRSPSRRWLLYPVFAVLALASIGGGYETVREAADANAYPMPGQLIDVGGHRLHLRCTGSGSPTVVLEPGAGEMSSNLGWITPAPRRTACRSPPTCTPCCSADTCQAPMYWPATPSAASTCWPSPPGTPTTSPGWCSWTRPHRRRRSKAQHRLTTGALTTSWA